MSHEAASKLVEFDAEGALERAREMTSCRLRTCAEFTRSEFRLLYLRDDVEAAYGGVESVLQAGQTAHEYGAIDFFERTAIEEMFAPVGTVRALVAMTDAFTLIRVLGNGEGLYVAVESGEDVTALVEELEAIVAVTIEEGQ